MNHSPSRLPEPSLLLLFLRHCGLWVIKQLLVPAEGKNSCTSVQIRQPKNKVPLFSRVKILIGHSKDAKCVPIFVLLQSSIDLRCVVLCDPTVVPFCNLMLPVKVFGCFLNDRFSHFGLANDFAAGVDNFDLTGPKVGFTIQFKLLAHLFVDGFIKTEKDDFSVILTHPGDCRPSLLESLGRLSSLSLGHEPI